MQCGDDVRRLNRLKGYAKGSVMYNVWNVDITRVCTIERTIKSRLKEKYKLARGTEWFEGSLHAIRTDVQAIIQSMEQKELMQCRQECTDQQTTSKHQCQRCQHSFASAFSLKRHYPTCKGVFNPLQCHLCFRVFANSGNKCRHLKKCRTLFISSGNSEGHASVET